MRQMLYRLLSAAAILAFAVALAGAQTMPPPPSPPNTAGGLKVQEAPAPLSQGQPQEKVMDGPVKKVDPQANTISVGWMLGLLSTTLDVTPKTDITVDGTKASLMDIREGDEVKTSYEVQNGKNIAKSIEATSIEATQSKTRSGASAPGNSPGPASAPSVGSSQGAGAPLTGAPKTP